MRKRSPLLLLVALASVFVLAAAGCESEEQAQTEPTAELQEPTAAPEPTATATATATPIPTFTPTVVPTETATPVPTATPPPTATPISGPADHGDDIASATRVSVGSSTAGAIETMNDEDYFVFTALMGQAYQLDVEVGTLSDSLLTLYDSRGVELASDDDSGDVWASRLVWVAPSSGDYFIKVSRALFGETGTYTLVIVETEIAPDDHGDDIASATRVTVGSTTQGVLNSAADEDLFVFQARAGQRYELDVRLDTLGDSVLTLYDARGVELASDDDSGDWFASQLVWVAPSSGDFLAKVHGGLLGGEGTYSLVITRLALDDHGDDIASATRVTAGSATQGVLDRPADEDFFVFQARAGQRYKLDVRLDTLGDSVLTLYDARGVELASDDDSGDWLASQLVWVAPSSGDFLAKVHAGLLGGEGTYMLTIVEN